MKEAIQKAIDGGWKPWWIEEGYPYKISTSFVEVLMKEQIQFVWWAEFVTDRTFWQALGKALGWSDKDFYENNMVRWFSEWHRFIDHLAEGKDVNEFFTNLLEK